MRLRLFISATVGGALAVIAAVGVAQVGTVERGVQPYDDGASFEVGGINVDVTGKSADAARLGGWRLAQRKAWMQLSNRFGRGGGLVSDATLDAVVSGIVVEREQIGPERYIAKLGVLFNRARAGSLLGISAYADRSPPLLVIPVEWSGGAGHVFGQATEWQRAWARYRTGNSVIDYVRPSGTGPDPLLLNVGQTERRSRGWWRTILDQYGADDILVPTVRLYRQWPGGPVIGVFEARYGPDNKLIEQFTLRVGSSDHLPQLLDVAVGRLDTIYQQALRRGILNPDPTLQPPPEPVPAVEDVEPSETLDAIITGLPTDAAEAQITLQYDSPGVTSVSATEATVLSIPGVTSATTNSLALGGISLMRVTYSGDPALLRSALEARGYRVTGTGQTLRIRRNVPAATPAITPDPAAAPIR